MTMSDKDTNVQRRKKRRSSPANRYISKFSLPKVLKRTKSLNGSTDTTPDTNAKHLYVLNQESTPKMFHWRYLEKERKTNNAMTMITLQERYAVHWLQYYDDMNKNSLKYNMDSIHLPPVQKQSVQHNLLPNFQQMLDFCGLPNRRN